jgi:hypothetical protein
MKILNYLSPIHILCVHLPSQSMYGRSTVKDSANEFQFHCMRMVNGHRGKWHLFLIPFAHLIVASFFALFVISYNYNSFISEEFVHFKMRFFYLFQMINVCGWTQDTG